MQSKFLLIVLCSLSITHAMNRRIRNHPEQQDAQAFWQQTICESPFVKKATQTIIYGTITSASAILLCSSLYKTLNCFSNSCVSGPHACHIVCPADEFITLLANDILLGITSSYSWDKFHKLTKAWCCSNTDDEDIEEV